MEIRELEVTGDGGAAVPCIFFEEGRERVAVVLPGAIRSGGRLGGAPSRPDLSYTRALLLALGFGVLEVWWDVDTMPDEYDPWLRANALAALDAAGAARVGLLVGRSLGTCAIASLDDSWAATAAIFLAPVTPAWVAIRQRPGRSFVVIGDADERYDGAAVEAWRAAGKDVVVVPGANHGFEVADPAESARRLGDVLDRMRVWITGAVATSGDL
jgi:hypothetical protein